MVRRGAALAVLPADEVAAQGEAGAGQADQGDDPFGYRAIAGQLDMNKNTMQRIFQLKGSQARKRAVGSRPRIEAKVSAA